MECPTSTPCDYLLSTNDAPNQEEIVQIKRFLEGPLTELEQLKKEIAPQRDKLNYLLDSKRQAVAIIDKHAPRLHPIQCLPQDLLGEIFYRCLPMSILEASMAHNACPMLLVRICSSWRRLAFKLPQLWACLHITIPKRELPMYDCSVPERSRYKYQEKAQEVLDARTRGIKEWLGRSGALPLDIFIDHQDLPEHSTEEAPFARPIALALLPSVSRWRTLISVSGITPAFSPILHLPPSSFPLLQSFLTDVYQYVEADVDGLPTNTRLLNFGKSPFIQAPRLETLFIRYQVGGSQNPAAYHIQWSQLRHLSFEWNYSNTVDDEEVPLYERDLLSILSSCSSLISFRLGLGDIFNKDDDRSLNQSVTLPRLTELILINPDASYGLISCLHTPMLKDLHINSPTASWEANGSWTFTETNVYKFFERTGATLQSLTYNPNKCTAADLVACLRLCPSLKQLNIEAPHWMLPNQTRAIESVDPRLLQLLSGQIDDEDVLCPELEVLTGKGFAFAISEHDILAFLKSKQSRVRGVVPIRRLSISLLQKDPSDPSALAEIEAFRKGDAVKINVEYRMSRSQYSGESPFLFA